MANMPQYFIVTGDPGIGKTTVIKRLVEKIKKKGISPQGFYTEEVRKDGVRQGFDVITLEGERGKLARDASIMDVPAGFTVGKYGVLLHEFEKVVLPAMKKSVNCEAELLVIDEIGKMEIFSEKFKRYIKVIFSPNSSSLVLATIPVSKRSDPVIEFVRNNPLTKIWTVTRQNRNTLHEEILMDLGQVLRFQ